MTDPITPDATIATTDWVDGAEASTRTAPATKCGCHPTEGVEQCHHFWHRGQLNSERKRRADTPTQGDPRQDHAQATGAGPEDLAVERRGDDREQHPRRAEPVAPDGGSGVGQSPDPEDKEDRRTQVDEVDEAVVHWTISFS